MRVIRNLAFSHHMHVFLSLSHPLKLHCPSYTIISFSILLCLYLISSFQAVEATNRSDVASPVEGELDVVALTMIQSTFRGHLARCSLAIER